MAALVAALAAGPRALADGYAFRAEPTFRLETTDIRDATGVTQRSEQRAFDQTYRLSLDKTIFPLLRFSGTGTFIDTQLRSETGGFRTESDSEQWNGVANLNWGNPVLGGGFGYSRADTRDRLSTSLLAASPGRGSVTESFSAFTRWKPLDLPSLHARVARSTERALDRDTTIVQGSLKSEYAPVKQVQLNYTLGYADTRDDLSAVETTNVTQRVRATYADDLFDRSSAYLAYNLAHSSLETDASGVGGLVTLQRSPIAGLSIVMPADRTPGAVTLVSNLAVIDGVLDGPPAAPTNTGIDIGFGPALTGDTALREVGIQLLDATEPVNTLHVWVEEPLPPTVVAAYGFTVYRSDDNVTWTAVPIIRAVAFGLAGNRFEITTAEIRAEYVKVSVAPLAPAAAASPDQSRVLVTELQAFSVVPAASVIGRTTSFRDSVNGTVTTRLLASPILRHDFSFNVIRADGDLSSWLIANGLSLSHRLTPILTLSARTARTDSRSGRNHVGQFLYGGTLAANPSPTFGSALTLSGTITQAPGGTSVTNAASASARANLYEGVDTNGNLSYSISTSPDDLTTRNAVASANATVTPHRLITFTAGAGTTRTDASGGGFPETTRTSTRLDLTAGSSPFPTLFLSAGVSRLSGTGTTPRTLGSLGVSWSPLTGADLTLQLTHSQSFDTASESVARNSQANVRWRMVRNLELSTGYTLAELDTLQSETQTRGFFATLLFTLS